MTLVIGPDRNVREFRIFARGDASLVVTQPVPKQPARIFVRVLKRAAFQKARHRVPVTVPFVPLEERMVGKRAVQDRRKRQAGHIGR